MLMEEMRKYDYAIHFNPSEYDINNELQPKIKIIKLVIGYIESKLSTLNTELNEKKANCSNSYSSLISSFPGLKIYLSSPSLSSFVVSNYAKTDLTGDGQ